MAGSEIELKPGIAYCFRRFHGLVTDLVQGAWIRFIRKLPANQKSLGQASDLAEFLFGSERADLSAFRPILRDLQSDLCFYCERPLQRDGDAVDHFIPWAWYPADLGHNFVLAHSGCNSSKSDRIASYEHLERWCARNAEHGHQLAAEFEQRSLLFDMPASCGITRWAYDQVEISQAKVWRSKQDQQVDLDRAWKILPGMSALWTPPPRVRSAERIIPPLVPIRAYPDLRAAAGAVTPGSEAQEPDALAVQQVLLPVAEEGDGLFAVRASGHSMDGGKKPIRDGDWLVFRLRPGAGLAAVEGQIVLVQVPDEHQGFHYQVKRVIADSAGWRLRSENPAAGPPVLVIEGTRVIAVLLTSIHPEELAQSSD